MLNTHALSYVKKKWREKKKTFECNYNYFLTWQSVCRLYANANYTVALNHFMHLASCFAFLSLSSLITAACTRYCVCIHKFIVTCVCRSVEDGPVSLSRCSCCEVRSPSSWTSSSPTPDSANLCPSSAFSSDIDLCLGPLSIDWQEQSGSELVNINRT